MSGFSIIRIVQVGFKSLRLYKLRSALTMLGMIIGVWAVITLVAIGERASQDAQEAIKALGAKNVIIRSIKPPSMRSQMHGDWESFSAVGWPTMGCVEPMRFASKKQCRESPGCCPC